MHLGEVIAKLRKARGLTQNELGDAAQLSTTIIAKLEHGNRTGARPKTILALARALDAEAPLDEEAIDQLAAAGSLDLRAMLTNRKAARVVAGMQKVMREYPQVRRTQQINAAIAQFPPVERGLCLAVLEFSDTFGTEAASILMDALSRVASIAAAAGVPTQHPLAAPPPPPQPAEPERVLTHVSPPKKLPYGAIEEVHTDIAVPPPARATRATAPKRKEA